MHYFRLGRHTGQRVRRKLIVKMHPLPEMARTLRIRSCASDLTPRAREQTGRANRALLSLTSNLALGIGAGGEDEEVLLRSRAGEGAPGDGFASDGRPQ